MISGKSNRANKALKAIEAARRMEAAKSLVLLDLAHPPDQAHMAQVLLVSTSKLQKDFRQYSGSSIRDYWLSERMKRAEYLLAETTKSILQISKELGYAGPSAFTDIFRRKHHSAPGEWRKINRKLLSV